MVGISQSARIQLWLARFTRHANSGQTVSDFCQQEQISVPSFYQWKRRLTPRVESTQPRRKQHSNGSPSANSGDGAGFTELVVHSAPVSAHASLPAHVSLPGGVTISLGTHPAIASLIVDRLLKHSANLVNAETLVAEKTAC